MKKDKTPKSKNNPSTDHGVDKNLEKKPEVKGRVSMSKKTHKLLAKIPLIGKWYN